MTALRISSLALAAIAVLCAIAAFQLGLWAGGVPGSGFFPLVAALMLFVTSIAVAVQDLDGEGGNEPVNRLRLVGYVAALLAFGVAFKLIGTVLATFAFITGVLRGLERLRWLPTLAVAVALASLSWLLFKQFLGVPLPTGVMEIS